jgi:hypothetical protein
VGAVVCQRFGALSGAAVAAVTATRRMDIAAMIVFVVCVKFVLLVRLDVLNSPLKNRRASENEDFGVRARRETGGKVVTFVEDFATQP